MKKILEGKTKDLYEIDDHHLLMKFKDDVTGEDGVFNPGANQVGLKMEGISQLNLRLSKHFFEDLNEMGVSTHYCDADINDLSMKVRKANLFGHGIEVICRFHACGSFIKRYGAYIEEGSKLPAYVEFTLKDDERNDPLISKDALIALEILTKEDYEAIETLSRQISIYIKNECAKHNLELYDIKLEFARDIETNNLMLIDEISSGSMRVYQNGHVLDPFSLSKIILQD